MVSTKVMVFWDMKPCSSVNTKASAEPALSILMVEE
jgi:hypothetical protein